MSMILFRLIHAIVARFLGKRFVTFCLHSLSILAIAISLSGCNDPQPTLPFDNNVQTYGGEWQYRYGDSPKLPNYSYAFAQVGHDDGGWSVTKDTWSPAKREKNNILWLRTRLTGPEIFDPLLHSLYSEIFHEVYLDGKLINQIGEIPPKQNPLIGASMPLFIRLPQDYVGRTLVIRLYSPYRTIGISSPVLLGGRAEIVLHLVRKGIAKPLLGFLQIAMSIVGLVVFLIRRRERSFLYFFLFSIVTGAYVCISRNPIRYIFSSHADVFWGIELSCLSLIGLFLCALFQSLFGPGPLHLTQLLKYAFIFFIAAVIALVWSGFQPAMYFLSYLQMLHAFTVIYLSLYCFTIAWMGNADARIFASGFFLAMVLVIYDLLTLLLVLPGSLDSPPYSSLIVVITFAVMLSSRFLALNKRLKSLSSMIQGNLASANQLDDQEHAQLALKQVLELLPVSRASLFLSGPSPSRVHWVSGRDLSGPTESSENSSDRELAHAVLSRGRPLAGRAELAPPTSGKRGSAPRLMGMPLRAQEQLLGVVCVELRAATDSLKSDDSEVFEWLCNQLALSLMTARAQKMEASATQDRRRLVAQGELLGAAARLARGDLDSPIPASSDRELLSLSQALESMRQDLQTKFQTLHKYNTEISELNEELRRQIDQRSRRVLDLALAVDGQKVGPKAHFQPGALLGVHYRVLRLLGQGTMGSVYEVERTSDGRHLAAKVLAPRADKPTMVRFAREAQILARLKHPNLISIVDVDVTDNGILFLIMELVSGTNLRLCQDRYGDLSFAIPVLRQMAAGLAAIHAASIVHRDLKPANVLISNDEMVDGGPLVKLVDFGISTLAASDDAMASGMLGAPGQSSLSRLTDENKAVGSAPEARRAAESEQRQHTGTNIVIGTPAYMAPESAERSGLQGVRPSADVWSFGVIAFELLSRQLPFEQPPVVAMAMEETVTLATLAGLRSDLPRGVAGLIQSCLSLVPEQRPTAAAVEAALSAIALPFPAASRRSR